MLEILQHIVSEHQTAVSELRPILSTVQLIAEVIWKACRQNRRIYTFGNGGSAAEAQHLAAELIGRFRMQRRPLPAMALTADSTVLTCIGNDYDFTDIFARQLQALVRPGDVAIGFTTSGNSPNVLKGLAQAATAGADTVVFTGMQGRKAKAKYVLWAAAESTPRIQEIHVLYTHMICELLDRWAIEAGYDKWRPKE